MFVFGPKPNQTSLSHHKIERDELQKGKVNETDPWFAEMRAKEEVR